MRLSEWYFLLLVPLVIVFHRTWVFRNKPAKVTFPRSLPGKVRRWNPLNALLILRYLGLLGLAIALARPQTSFRHTERTLSGVDILLIMDVSASMNIEDMEDRSRIDVAKETLINFVKGRSNDRIGFVVFSGEPLTLVPPTLDYGLLMTEINEIELGRLKDGTGIGDGLALGVSRLRTSESKSKVIVLITDGDNNVGAVDPPTAGELAHSYGIRVYTIALGKEGRVKMPVRQMSPFGKPIVTYQWYHSTINPQVLMDISEKTSAKFFRVTDPETLSEVFREIDALEKTEIKTKDNVKYEDAFLIPLLLGAFLLLLEQLIRIFLVRWAI